MILINPNNSKNWLTSKRGNAVALLPSIVPSIKLIMSLTIKSAWSIILKFKPLNIILITKTIKNAAPTLTPIRVKLLFLLYFKSILASSISAILFNILSKERHGGLQDIERVRVSCRHIDRRLFAHIRSNHISIPRNWSQNTSDGKKVTHGGRNK